MKEVKINKSRIRDYLAEQLTKKILQTDEKELYAQLRFKTIGGFETLDQEELFKETLATIPEFQLIDFTRDDNEHVYVAVKQGYASAEDDILVDITRVIQTKF